MKRVCVHKHSAEDLWHHPKLQSEELFTLRPHFFSKATPVQVEDHTAQVIRLRSEL